MNVWLNVLAIEATVSWYPTAERYRIKIVVQILPPALAKELISLGVHVPSAMSSPQMCFLEVFSVPLCITVQLLLLLSFPNQVWFSNSCSVDLVCMWNVQNKGGKLLRTSTSREDERHGILRAWRSRTLCVHNWFCVLLVCVWWVICQYRDCTGKRKWLQKWWRRPYLNEGFVRIHSFCHTGYGRAEWLQVRNDCSPASATKDSTGGESCGLWWACSIRTLKLYLLPSVLSLHWRCVCMLCMTAV